MWSHHPLPHARPTERKRGSGAQIVFDVLRDEILDLRLPPGHALDELQLADRFAMSRTPIREALVRLAGEGLVTTLPNRTSVVSEIDFLNLRAFLDALVLMYRVTTRLAAENRRDADLLRIRGYQAAFVTAVAAGDALAMIAANRDFHAAIADAGANSYFAALCHRLLDEGRRMLRLYYDSFGDRLPQVRVDEHEAMIAAIEAGEVEEADGLARTHAQGIADRIRELLVGERRFDIEL